MDVRLFKPSLGESELKNVREAFERSWVGFGGQVQRFEEAWSAHLGGANSLALNSGTAALQLAVQAFGFEPGSKVMVPAITFAATAMAAINNRLVPVFVDVDERTASLSVQDMERKYSPDVVAVIPVHYAGHPADMEAIVDFARSKGMKVIEDCAHTPGSRYGDKPLGLWGDFGCFSFEEKKCLTTGDGGMLCATDSDLLERVRPARWLGIDKDVWHRFSKERERKAESGEVPPWYYEVTMPGHKFNMNDLAATIGLAQLERLPAMNRRRSEIVKRYLEGIGNTNGMEPLIPFEPERYTYQIFGLRVDRRDELIAALNRQGISSGVHYMPLGRHPFFREWASPCPVADRIWTSFVTLPLHPDLTDAEVDRVLEAVSLMLVPA